MSIIQVKDLTKTFRVYEKTPGFAGSLSSLFNRKYIHKTAIKNISFSIEKGELVGFIGPNGAGKTTTLKCLSGLLHPSEGKVSVMGYTPFERNHEYLKRISLVMGQKNQMWWDLPPSESFLLNKEIYDVSDKKFKKTLADLVDLLDVADVVNIQVRNLSLGQRMKCELIAQLLHEPDVLFLDEPTIGLDVVMQHNLRGFIKEYNRKNNSTVMLTSHYMGDVSELCKRVIVIDHGSILYDGKFSTLTSQHTKNKILKVIFTHEIKKGELTKLGKIRMYDPHRAIIAVPKEKSNKVAAHLLEKFPVDDLNIEEPAIEDIIRSFFNTSRK